MSETGSVKFNCDHVVTPMPRFREFDKLNECRRKLLKLGLVGVDGNGIGFGNVSVRDGASAQFYITGSATGGIAELTPANCAKVVRYDFRNNWLRCEGSTVASSESLTHAAIYEADPAVNAVIHCHDTKLWTSFCGKAPTTPKEAEYGTPEMAYAVWRLFENSDVQKKKMFVMSAHDGGIVTFGKDLEEAFETLLEQHTRA